MMHTPRSKSSNYINGTQQTISSKSTSGFVLSSSPQKTTRPVKERNNKIIEGQTARGRLNEKCSSKLSELEASFVQLQEELKKTTHQGSSSMFQKRQALKETNAPSSEMFSSEVDDRLQEMCIISQQRDKAWALELAAVRKHHSLDIAALTSAKVEIQKLKKQLQIVTESEAVQTKRAEFAEEEVRKLQSEIKSGLDTVSLSTSKEHEEDANQLEIKPQVHSSDEVNILLEKVKQLQAIAEKNEKMKLELQKAKTEKNRAAKRAAASAEARKIAESKVMYLTQQADQNSTKVAGLAEQLEAAYEANMESEMELRRQKVQCDQWRKAAEVAAAMLNRDSDKQLDDKSESQCNSHLTSNSYLVSESYSDNEDDTLKKRNGGMLQKVSVLWKKSNSIKKT